jgi:23S rRNA (cytidine2498-2'-O)-methyltransferase
VLLVLAAADSKDDLEQELSQELAGVARELHAGMFGCDVGSKTSEPFPYLAFARQIAPDAREIRAPSIKAWANVVVDAVGGTLPDHQPWSLHVYPFREDLGSPRMGARAWHSRAREGRPLPPRSEPVPKGAGQNRCRLVRAAVIEQLEKRRRHLGRYLRPDFGPFFEDEALAQVILISPERGFLSIAPAPLPFQTRHVLSFFPGGEFVAPTDKQAPSRAFGKLVEAEARLGRRIAAREVCIDLGASPGSWTYVAARRGARVTAVDRAELRPDLMQHPRVIFQRGDAFGFEPATPADWLLCDVIASAERSAQLLLRWLQNGWCRHFVVTLKVDDRGSSDVLSQMKRDLPALTSELWLSRLCANKKEVCAFGTLV